MITYTVYARDNHYTHVRVIQKELRKDYPWQGFKISTEEAIKRVCEKLGYCFIRKDKVKGSDNYVIGV